MKLALDCANISMEQNEVPIGAVIISKGKVIGKGYNQVEQLHDATAHAELIALSAAMSFLNSKYLRSCILYCTLEPCAMCAGALSWTQIGGLVYAASDHKKGYMKFEPNVLHPKTKVISGIMEDKSKQLLQTFFLSLRK